MQTPSSGSQNQLTSFDMGIEAPEISSSEGSISGLRAAPSHDAFAGRLQFSIPIATPVVRQSSLDVRLDYDSAAGNGAFGLGFSLNILSISIKPQRVPKYDGTDQYMMSGAGLLVQATAEARLSEGYRIETFRPIKEEQFSKIERWVQETEHDVHWRVTDVANTVSIFGQSRNARIFNPDAPTHIYTWLLEERSDAYGNTVRYVYAEEDGASIPQTPAFAGRDRQTQRYLSSIRFGNFRTESAEDAWAFQLLFDYGQYDFSPANPDPTQPVRTWSVRPDPFSTYRPGFEVRTWRRCEAIALTHCFPDELGSTPLITRLLKFNYDAEGPLSRLKSVRETGWRTRTDGTIKTLSSPPISLTWTTVQQPLKGFRPLQFEGGCTFGPNIDDDPPRLVDIDGEGIPGLLVSNSTALLYWRNLGDGRFAPPASPRSMPNLRNLETTRSRLAPLDRFGRLDLVVESPAMAGYFGNRGSAGWSPFTPFESPSLAVFGPNTNRVDLSGAGSSDLLAFANGERTWALSEYTKGYSSSRNRANIPTLPNPSAAPSTTALRFANMFGDSMAHLTEIGSGFVRVWPNLGYGVFGEPVEFENAPDLPDIATPDRIFLTDTDGTGTADLVLVLDQYIEIYRNIAGNTFAPPYRVSLPAPWETIDALTFGDVLATGTNAAIVSLAIGETRHFYCDFSDGRKTNLLQSIDNGRGGVTEITWRASTQFQLQDAKVGRPWITAAPFPVQVVSKLVTQDSIAQSATSQNFAYHDAYYDPVLFSFRGFAEVETWDSELFQIETDKVQYSPTAHTKSWFINGAYEAQPALQARWRDHFFHGSSPQIALPYAFFDLGDQAAEGAVQRQGWSALAGSKVRTEVYGLDPSPETYLPYTVEEFSWTVVAQQAPTGSQLGVFFCAQNQRASIAYERTIDDPRTTHTLTLARNKIGLPLLAVDVAYTRSADAPGWLPQQGQLSVTATRTVYASPVDGSHLLSAKAEEHTFVCDGVCPAGLYFTAADLKPQMETALAEPLMPEQPFSGMAPQARWAQARRVRYLDGATSAPLPLGAISSPQLVWRRDETAFTPQMLEINFGSRLDPLIVQQEGGYALSDDFWWSVSSCASYAPRAAFYQQICETDPFGTTSLARYDRYDLSIAETVDGNGQTTRYVTDYQAMAPAQITDINGIVAQAIYDPFGEVMATSSFGVIDGIRQGDGDLTAYTPLQPSSKWDVLDNPQKYLQNATSYVYRDPHQWDAALADPPANVSVSRQTSIDGASAELPISIVVTYFDGSDRELQVKTLVEGAAVNRAADSWVTSGQTLYNNKGEAVRLYVPTIQKSPAFEREPEDIYDSVFYDAVGRRNKVLTAKGFLEEKVYRTWSMIVWDRDDTVTRSPYYIDHIHDTDPNFRLEREALLSASALAETPTITHVDPRAAVIQVDTYLKSAEEPQPVTLSTVSLLDRLGRTVAVSDPRFTAHNSAGGDPLYNVQTSYDMGETALVTRSCDAGTTRQFQAVDGKPVRTWTASDDEYATAYTGMRLPRTITLTPSDGTGRLVERFEYGTDASRNLNERLIEHWDEAGRLSFSAYDLNGNATATSRSVLQSVAEPVDWSKTPPPSVGDPITIESSYTIAGSPLQERGPDGTGTDYRYYRTGWLSSQTMTKDGVSVGSIAAFVYSARGDRTASSCENGVLTTRAYEETTGRLLNVSTLRLSDSKPLQDISYTYDPMGNVTSIVDNSINDIVTGHELVDPNQSYTYDSLYRLIGSSGRQAKGIGPESYHSGFMGTEFIDIPHPNDTSKLIRFNEWYSYDLSGNPLSLVHTTSDGTGNFTRRYAVSQTSNHSVPATMIEGGGSVDDYYNASGDMTGLPNLPHMRWSAGGTLTRAVIIARDGDQPDDVVYYLYGSDKQRVLTVRERLIDGGAGIDQTTTVSFGRFRIRTRARIGSSQAGRCADEVRTRQLTVQMLGGERLNVIAHFWEGDSGPQQDVRYQYPTDLGSVALELDASASILSYEEYFAFGGSAFIAGPDKVEVAEKLYRFAGKERDDATGLYYFGARYYASWLCRWISPDPAGTEDGLNLYAYVNNNPISRVDETGLCGVPGQEINKPPSPAPQPTPFTMSPVLQLATGAFAAYQTIMGSIQASGIKPVVHAASKETVVKIQNTGLTMNAGSGGITPSRFPNVAARAQGVNFVTDLSKFGSTFTHGYYSGLKYMLDTGNPLVSKGFLPPDPNFGSLPHMKPTAITVENTVMSLLPYNRWVGAKPDPDSVFKGITTKVMGRPLQIPSGVLLWDVGGAKKFVEISAGFRAPGAITIPQNIPKELIFGPAFKPVQLASEVISSVPAFVLNNPGVFLKGAARASVGGAITVLTVEQFTKDPKDTDKGFDRLLRLFN